MKVTIVGSGDAFGSGGRAHSCIRIDGHGGSLAVDFGAGSITAWKKLGLSLGDIDAVVISHLHGDHFGGLPFLLLDCQYVSDRKRPLRLLGPPGFEVRLGQALEAFFPGAGKTPWSFSWRVEEILARRHIEVAGLTLETFEVSHPSGGLATGIRIDDGARVFAFSGDTSWTDTLLPLADGADLFVVECFAGDKAVPHHIDWPTLVAKLPVLRSKQTLLTHLGEDALARAAEMEAAGVALAYDGQVIDL
jgi:ribonuclease BN (tRNA processing enzyme)